MWQGRGIGFITMQRDELGAFPPKEHALLKAFADQAVIAIQNARLFNETQEALERQTATTEVLQVINASPGDLDPVFDAIMRNATQLCDASGGGLWMVEGDVARARGGRGGHMPQAYFDFLDEKTVPLKYLLSTGQPGDPYFHIADLKALPAYEQGNPFVRASVDLGGIRTSLQVPVREDGAIVAVFALIRTQVQPFSDKEIALVRAFAAQAQIAMKNARLMKETQEALEQQTASADVLRVIGNSVSDTAPVFERILSSAQRILSTNYVNIGLIGDDGLVHLNVNDTPLFPGDPMYPKVVEWLHRKFPAPVRETMHGYCAHKHVVLHYPDAQHGPDVPPKMREATAWMGNSSQLCVPLVWNGKGIGAFGVARLPMKTLQRQGDRADQDLRRPGGDRDPEREDVQRDAAGAGAADRHGRDPEGHRRLARRRAAGVRRHRARAPTGWPAPSRRWSRCAATTCCTWRHSPPPTPAASNG